MNPTDATEVLKGRGKKHVRTVRLFISRALMLALASGGCALRLAGQNQAPKGSGTAAVSAVSAQAGPSKKPDPASVERGKALFSSNCGFCHGAHAKGGETGPDLIRSLIVLDDDRGELISAAVSNGRPERGMPKFAFSDDQMTDLVTFLHNQVHAAAAFTSYQVLNIVVGDAKAGEAYFNGAGGCSSCHSVGSDLAHIGSKYAPVDLQQRFIMPRGEAGPSGRSQSDGAAIEARVTVPSGESYEGHLMAIDDFSLTLIDAKGERRSFSRDGDTPSVELKDPLRKHIDLISKYTDSDIHNLTAYLVTLR
jgi:mono/diheme cytochrome c family protein